MSKYTANYFKLKETFLGPGKFSQFRQHFKDPYGTLQLCWYNQNLTRVDKLMILKFCHRAVRMDGSSYYDWLLVWLSV